MSTQNIENQEQFKKFITQDKSIIMIKKQDCPFCDKAMPWLEEFSNIKIGIVDKDVIPNLLEKFNLIQYPTFLKINKGVIENIFHGDTQYEKVKEFITS